MNRDRLLIIWSFVLIGLGLAVFIIKNPVVSSDNPSILFIASVTLIGLSANIIASSLAKLGKRIDQLERKLKDTEGPHEALESLRARIEKLEQPQAVAPGERPASAG